MSKLTKREHNFIALRITNALSEAATMAANWGVTRENFVRECGVAWDQTSAMLNHGVEDESATLEEALPSNPAVKVGQVWACKDYGDCVITYVSDRRLRMRWITGKYLDENRGFDSTGVGFFSSTDFATLAHEQPVPAVGQIWDYEGMRFTNRRPHYSDRGSPDQKQNGWSYAVNANRDEVEWFLLDSFKYCTFIGYENDPDQE